VATAVLVSGTGTILESVLAVTAIDVVAADRECRGLDVARGADIATVLVDRRAHGGFGKGFDRQGYTDALGDALGERSVDLVCMAGFGTVLSPSFFERFAGRVLNTHPSLLPRYPGWRAVEDALRDGAVETGCTVHVATAALDDGPILCQEPVEVRADDDEATLHERIKAVERRLYPATIVAVRAALDAGEAATSVATAPAARR
jgi:phosphoribosylglycinamide formyltransferase-1